jgi:EAL domain-containing protein (putative c-di-GMP-specific phosphodiesterase class I)
LNQLALTDRSWAALLERACGDRLISAVFQPIVDTARGVVCGYEALSRFHASGPSSPQEWFSAAALHGYSGRLEAAALETILGHRDALPQNCFLSINLSPDGLVAPEVQAVLGAQDDLARIVVEITEQTPVEDYAGTSAILDAMRARGALVAVDDTGAGYASLRHLLDLRPNLVKLDRSLVTGVDADPARASAVAAIGAFAGELDAWLLAEGVETDAELERLLDLGVPLVQGYLLGRPGPEMGGIDPRLALRLRTRRGVLRHQPLLGLARPAPTVRSAPDLVAACTVIVDQHERPLEVVVPGNDGRRASRYPAMGVQPHDDLVDVALRATARPTEERFAPLCLCDELGRVQGLIPVDALLESLGREVRRLRGKASPD